MGDFDACRFDFRIDNKNGLTPSRRKRTFKRSVYNTLFNCKICGLLFDSRPALLEHKTQHSDFPCTYCTMKFTKKNQLREHVNTAHYIDKLKAGYKTEYGRTKSTVEDVSMVNLPPLIPVADVDGELPTMINSHYGFGSDAMATSSPVQKSPGSQHSPTSLTLDSRDTSDPGSSVFYQEMARIHMDGSSSVDEPGSSSINNSSPYMFPGFPFGGMPNLLPTIPQASGSSSGCSTHTPSALQTAMASFFPFTSIHPPTAMSITTTTAAATTSKPSPTSSTGLSGHSDEGRSPQSVDGETNSHEDNDDAVALKAAYQAESASPVRLQLPVIPPPSAKSPQQSTSPQSTTFIPIAPKKSTTPESVSIVNQTINDLTCNDSKAGSDSGFSSFNQSGTGPMSPQASGFSSFMSNLQAKSVASDNPLSLLPKTPNAKILENSAASMVMSLLPAPVSFPSNRLSPVHTTIGALLEAVEARSRNKQQQKSPNLPVASFSPLPKMDSVPKPTNPMTLSVVPEATQKLMTSPPAFTAAHKLMTSPPAIPSNQLTTTTVTPSLPALSQVPFPSNQLVSTTSAASPVIAGMSTDPNATLPPGYMMMTLVVTSQPGGGIAAVPLIPGYTYPMLPSQTATTSSTATGLPPLLPASATVPTVATAAPLSAAMQPSMINAAAMMKNMNGMSELEPGEINKNHPQHTAMMPPLIPAPAMGLNTPNFTPNFTQMQLPGSSNLPASQVAVPKLGALQNYQSLYTAPKITTSVQQPMVLPENLPSQSNLPTTSVSQSNLGLPSQQTMPPNFTFHHLLQTMPALGGASAEAQALMASALAQQTLSPGMQSPMMAMSQMVNRNDVSKSTDKANIPNIYQNQQTKQQSNVNDSNEADDIANRTSKKRKQSCPSRTLHKALKTSTDESMDMGDSAAEVLDLSAKTDDDDNEKCEKVDLPDRVKELERYISQDGGFDQSFSNTNQESSHQCEMCDVVCENMYMLNKHKATAHKTGLGLSKMVDRLWQTKKEPKRKDARLSRENSVTPTLHIDESVPDGKDHHLLHETIQQNSALKPQNDLSNKQTGSEALISDTARQVYMQMMTAALKSPEMNIPPTVGKSGSNFAGPLTVSECETNSGIFGHYRIKKPKMDDYCTFKFHTCKVCKQLFNTAEQMWDHALIHKELQRFKCSFKGCNYSSVSRQKLIQHKAYVHQQDTKVETPHPAMDEFSLIGHQMHYPCEFEGCDSVFFLPGELVKHVDRVHQKLQCPEEGCTQSFYTMGGMKSHQVSHREDTPLRLDSMSQPAGGRSATASRSNKVHSITKPSVPKKPLVCPLCKYAAQQRRSMNGHMKNKHGLDKVKTSHNRTVYVDGEGNMVCSFRTEYFTGGDYSESSSGGYESPNIAAIQRANQAVNYNQAPPTPRIETTPKSEQAPPTPNMELPIPMPSNMETTADGIQITENETEEITVGDNNTIATKDGTTILPPTTQYTTELVYMSNDPNEENDQPLDFSMKKTTAKLSSNTNINNLNNDCKDVGSSSIENNANKTPIGIVQPFVHIPSTTAGNNMFASFLSNQNANNNKAGDANLILGGGASSSRTGASGHETPPLPQLVPMANPFTYLPQQSIGSPYMSHSNSPLPSSSSTPTSTGSSDGQFFNFKLKNGNKRKRAATASKTDEPINYTCKDCGQLFDCAEIMWTHRLKEHPETAKIFCDTCGFDTMDQAELQSHMMSTHGKEVGDNKAFTCFICSKGYSSKLGLNHHLMRHSEGGPPQFPCPYRGCDSILHSRGALGNHVKRVHLKPTSKQTVIDESKQVFYCDYPRCDRSFRESKHLRVHRMTHTDEKPLKCHVCEYSCRQRNSMNWHMKSKHGLEKRVSVDGKTIYV